MLSAKLSPFQFPCVLCFCIAYYYTNNRMPQGWFSQILLSAVLLFLCISQEIVVPLTSCSFRIENSTESYPCSPPSTLANDLIKIGKIPADPYYRSNFLEYYQYEMLGAVYTGFFHLPLLCRTHRNKGKLVFEGLDTYCDVYFNGEKVLTANNMFRRYEVEVTNLALTNNLTLRFNSSVATDLRKQKEFYDTFGYDLPVNFSFTRKSAYQYGWDWGPRIVTLGIWKPLSLRCRLHHEIRNLSVRLLTPITTKNPTSITIGIRATITNVLHKQKYIYWLILQNANNTTIFNISNSINASSMPNLEIYREVPLSDYSKNLSGFVWWTWDLGTPVLFNFTLIVSAAHSNAKVHKTVLTGFRTVSVVQEKDPQGTSFIVNLNGYDVFMRGASYIPPEMMMDTATPATYARIKQYALHAKLNMIRLWGGGQFENDEFYTAMDESGILIWHDLMFACAMYPATLIGRELESIQQELEDNLIRIRNHPSIALWSGNNEVWIGWQEWGWKNGHDTLEIYQLERMYKQIFKQLIPTVINIYTPDIFYSETSPLSSSGQLATISSGDIHFWRVWGEGADIELYEQYIGRFNSEWGMQSMPEFSSIIKFTNAEDRTINSSVMRLHERATLGDEHLSKYTNDYAGLTNNLSKFAYFSQVMQAYAMERAIVTLRGNKPYCMGSLYWQLNDVWPVSSWSTIDYYGTYKIAQYRVRELHSQLLIHVVHAPKTNRTSQTWKVMAVNDHDLTFRLFVTVEIIDFNGTKLSVSEVEKTVHPFDNAILVRPNITLTSPEKTRSFIHVRAVDLSSHLLYENNYFFVRPKDRIRYNPALTSTPLSSHTISITTEWLATYVWIRSVTYTSANLKNNYFDILPGSTVVVDVSPLHVSDIVISCYEIQASQGINQEQMRAVPE